MVDAFTDSLDPIKLYEYQAVGRPVVSTAVAGFRDADDDRIVIAAGDEFGDAVLSALAASRPFRPTPIVLWPTGILAPRRCSASWRE